jgi:septal ring factor EnvC (AmiA/AmiB activator)
VDALLPSLLGALPSLGIYAGFGYVLILLLRREATSEERHAQEITRIRRAHDEELEELRADVTRERAARRAVEAERDELRHHDRT